jgi:hypothetical protein
MVGFLLQSGEEMLIQSYLRVVKPITLYQPLNRKFGDVIIIKKLVIRLLMLYNNIDLL